MNWRTFLRIFLVFQLVDFYCSEYLEDFLRVCEFFRSCVVCESLVGAERKGGGEGGQSCVNCVREGGRERESI